MKLFLSFTTLLNEYVKGTITKDDLQSGVFALGATRERIIDMVEQDIQLEIQRDKNASLLAWKEVIIPALLQAEREERIIWRTVEKPISFDAFRTFLESFGLVVPNALLPYYASYPGVKKILLPVNKNLEIIA